MNELFYRVRFYANIDDPRPVIFPPSGPYWVTGFNDDYNTVVAYVKQKEEVLKFWPEATSIDYGSEPEEIIYTERFKKPSWLYSLPPSDNEKKE